MTPAMKFTIIILLIAAGVTLGVTGHLILAFFCGCAVFELSFTAFSDTKKEE